MADSKLSRTDVASLQSCLKYSAVKDPFRIKMIRSLLKITRTMRASDTSAKAWLQRIVGDEFYDQKDSESRGIQRKLKKQLEHYLRELTMPPYDPTAEQIQDPWNKDSKVDNPAYIAPTGRPGVPFDMEKNRQRSKQNKEDNYLPWVADQYYAIFHRIMRDVVMVSIDLGDLSSALQKIWLESARQRRSETRVAYATRIIDLSEDQNIYGSLLDKNLANHPSFNADYPGKNSDAELNEEEVAELEINKISEKTLIWPPSS